MYAKHVPIISEYMLASPEGFARGVAFVILSIRQPIRRVPTMLDALYNPQHYGRDSDPLFGHKRDAWAFVQEHKATLLRDVVHAPTLAHALEVLTRVPGLGVVKAGFVLQLMGYDVACLDSRNVRREGRNPRAFRSDGKKGKQGAAWAKKIRAYLSEVEGKGEEYWNCWCADVAKAYNQTAEDISALHLAIVPEDYVPF